MEGDDGRLRVECKVKRNVFTSKDNKFHIFGCEPIKGEVQLNKYGNFTIKGSLGMIEVGKEYTFDLEEIEDRYGISYQVTAIPSFDEFEIGDLDDITDDKEYQMLKLIMSDEQAENVHKAYPTFIRLILSGESDKIDCKQIYNVGKVRLKAYIAKVNNMFKYYKLVADNADIELKYAEAEELCSIYGSISKVQEFLTNNPYFILCYDLKRPIPPTDRLLLKVRPDMRTSVDRCEIVMLYLLQQNEADGNTRIAGDVFYKYVAQWDTELVPVMMDVIDSPNCTLVNYDKAKKILAINHTYLAEKKIADDIWYHLAHNTIWKCDTEKYKVVDGFEITNEQSKILDLLCTKNTCMLIGSAGCVDGETEFFNGEKWKRIDEYVNGDKVLQYNEDGSAELVEPLRYINEPCDEMYHIESKYGVNQTLTKDHNVVWWSQKGYFHKDTLADIMKLHQENKSGFMGAFKTTFDYSGSGIDYTDAEIRLMCAIFADGSFYQNSQPHRNSWNTCRFHIKKERKKARLKELFKECNLEYREKPSAAKGYTDFYIQAPKREKEFLPYWYNCSRHQMEIVCDEVIFWDGYTNYTKKGTKRISYSTTSKQSADFVQFAFACCGHRASILIDDRTGQEYFACGKIYTRKSIAYNVRITSRNMTSTGGGHIKKENMFQKVVPVNNRKYCFTVPSHMLVLRRNNRIFITGNSGKTSSVKAIITMLDDLHKSYRLLSPTGIAAKRLKEATGRDASTIHRAVLGEGIIDEDVVIIDEASMIGVELLAELLTLVSPLAKILFVFDSAQLASISCGNVVHDLIRCGKIPTAELTKVFRYGSSGISTVATDTRRGAEYLSDTGQLLCENAENVADYVFVPADEEPMEQIIDEYDKLRERYDDDEILVISPYNIGAFGTYAINNRIQTKYNPNAGSDNCMKRKLSDAPNSAVVFYEGDKVINKMNNYHAKTPAFIDWKAKKKRIEYNLEQTKELDGEDSDAYFALYENLEMHEANAPKEAAIMNGDIGYIKRIDGDYMYIQFDEDMVIFDKGDLQNLLLAYACSAHSVQGCEIKAVILITCNSHARMLTRNLCYMSLTRAKEMLVQIGDINAINHALTINETTERETWLYDLLMEEPWEKLN